MVTDLVGETSRADHLCMPTLRCAEYLVFLAGIAAKGPTLKLNITPKKFNSFSSTAKLYNDPPPKKPCPFKKERLSKSLLLSLDKWSDSDLYTYCWRVMFFPFLIKSHRSIPISLLTTNVSHTLWRHEHKHCSFYSYYCYMYSLAQRRRFAKRILVDKQS